MRARKVALYGLFLGFGMLLSYVESLLFPSVLRPGLANLLAVFLLYREGALPAALVNGLRVLLVAILFGNAASLAYSAAGAAASLIVMALLRRAGVFSPAGVSCAGGAAHNAAQTLVALLLVGKGSLRLLPVLLAAGAVLGFLTGLLSGRVLHAVRKVKF